MKYKLKDSYKGIYNRQFEKGQVIDSNDEYTGIVIEVPFTDQRFFEPIKTRKFQVEVSEDDVKFFNHFIANDDRWTVTEITEDKYLTALKRSGDVDLQVIEALQDTLYLERIVTAYQIIRDREKDKLSVVKGLKDYTNTCAASIKGLKNAKDIVYAWWDL